MNDNSNTRRMTVAGFFEALASNTSLAKLETLPPKNHVHHLTGYGKERKGEKFMECHIAPDWLLIWVQKDDEMILVLTNTGSHSNMF